MILSKGELKEIIAQRYNAKVVKLDRIKSTVVHDENISSNRNYRWTPDIKAFTTNIIGVNFPSPCFWGEVKIMWYWYSTPAIGTSIRSTFAFNHISNIDVSLPTYSYNTFQVWDHRAPFTTIGSAFPTLIMSNTMYWKESWTDDLLFMFLQFGFFPVGGVMPVKMFVSFNGYRIWFR